MNPQEIHMSIPNFQMIVVSWLYIEDVAWSILFNTRNILASISPHYAQKPRRLLFRRFSFVNFLKQFEQIDVCTGTKESWKLLFSPQFQFRWKQFLTNKIFLIEIQAN